VYLACHVRHPTRANTESGVSARDLSLLAHLAGGPMRVGELARHLGLTAGTVSAAVDLLAERGLLERVRDEHDRRRVDLRLTEAGARALEADSVLDAHRVHAVLATLAADERRRVVEGLEILAAASRRWVAAGPEEEGAP
jgi:DNA-binding MarR family transcriptional regulator